MPTTNSAGLADPGPVAGRRVEIARLEQLAEEPLDVEPGPVEQRGGLVDDLGRTARGRRRTGAASRRGTAGVAGCCIRMSTMSPPSNRPDLPRNVLAAGVVVVGVEDELGARRGASR